MISVVQVPDPHDDGGVAIALNILTQPLQFFVIVELGGNIGLFQLGHGVAGLGKDHHPHGVLQKVAAGFLVPITKKKLSSNLLVQPGNTADGAKGYGSCR